MIGLMENHNQAMEHHIDRVKVELVQEIRNIGAMTEELKSRLQALAEQVQHTSGKLDTVIEEIQEIKAKLDAKVDYKDFYTLEKRLAALEQKVNKTS
jgi:uncharacterized coiled-coil DUF342 family protein